MTWWGGLLAIWLAAQLPFVALWDSFVRWQKDGRR